MSMNILKILYRLNNPRANCEFIGMKLWVYRH